MTPDEARRWERTLKDHLWQYERIRPKDRQFRVEQILLEGQYPNTEIVYLFRHSSRPKCLFGFRWGTFWDWVEGEDYVRKHGPETPASLATIVSVNFEEAAELHLPERCSEGEITWIQ